MYKFGKKKKIYICIELLLVSQFPFSDDDLFHKPVSLPLYFLSILGCVAQADTSNIAHVLGRKLKPVNISPKKRGP